MKKFKKTVVAVATVMLVFVCSSSVFAGSNGVNFYQNTNLRGSITDTIPQGDYTLSELQSYGFVNNWASSVIIPEGLLFRCMTIMSFGEIHGC